MVRPRLLTLLSHIFALHQKKQLDGTEMFFYVFASGEEIVGLKESNEK